MINLFDSMRLPEQQSEQKIERNVYKAHLMELEQSNEAILKPFVSPIKKN